MKKYQFITDAVLVNKDKGMKQHLKKGDVIELTEQEALKYMSMAILTPYKEVKKVKETVLEPKISKPTIADIKKELDDLDIKYTQSMNKPELEALLKEATE